MKLVEKMELQTVVKLDKPSFRIDYSTRLMMLGSCFVENVGAKLEYFRFKTDINPCGIVYNPLWLIRWSCYWPVNDSRRPIYYETGNCG